MTALLRLRNADGDVVLHRRGWECKWFGVFLHKMTAPDPGEDLHNHPWPFVSFVLWGGYDEQRCTTYNAPVLARMASRGVERGITRKRRWLTLKTFPLWECHRIVHLHRPTCWTLVFRGPKVSDWGFFTEDGFEKAANYEIEPRGLKRGIVEDYA